METPNPNRGVDAFGASTHSTLATQEGLVPTRETAAPRGPRGEEERAERERGEEKTFPLPLRGRCASRFSPRLHAGNARTEHAEQNVVDATHTREGKRGEKVWRAVSDARGEQDQPGHTNQKERHQRLARSELAANPRRAKGGERRWWRCWRRRELAQTK